MWKRDEAVKPTNQGATTPAPAPTIVPASVAATQAESRRIERDLVNIGKSVVIKGELSGSEDLTMNSPAAKQLVVIGNGMVGQRLLESIAKANAGYEVTVLCEEPRPAYDRVHLSEFFSGKSAEDLSLVAPGFFADRSNVLLKLNARATAIDRAAKSGSIDLAVDTASVDTGDGDKGSRPRSRDEHLRSADFFNAAEFPKMTYKSTGVAFSGDNPTTIDGNLTLLGVTKPLQLTVERFKCNPAQGTGKERCGGNATGKLKRSDFGMKTGIPNLGDEVTLLIMFEALKD